MMALDAGWAAIIGAAIGGGLTIVGNWFLHYLQSSRADKLNEKRRATLLKMLRGEKYVWRNLKTLKAAIGADDETTCELLIEIDARASISNGKSWALIERAPFPEDMQPKD